MRRFGEFLKGTEAIDVVVNILLEGANHGGNDGWGENDALDNLVGSGEGDDEIEDEFMVTLKDEGTRGKDTAGDIFCHTGGNLLMTNLLSELTV